MDVRTWDAALEAEFLSWDNARQNTVLFVEQHPDYPNYLLVSSFDPLFPHKLKDLVGEYRAVHKLKIPELIELGDSEGYFTLISLDQPLNNIYNFLDELGNPYPYSLPINLKEFQLQGFNLTKDLPAAVINWSTGTGKSVYAVVRAKYLIEQGFCDKVVVVSKSHNKINWARTFHDIGGMEAHVAECPGSTASKKRDGRTLIYKNSDIFIINYEKLRMRDAPSEGKTSDGKKRPDPSGDGQELIEALRGKRVFWIWDEMPTKMKNMATGHYKGARKALKATQHNYQVMLSATPIEVSPEDLYSCMKILDPTVWPNVASFRKEYAKSFSAFSPWQVATWDTNKLKEMSMRISHMTHQANKYRDPKIRAEFPEEHWEDVIIDMSEQDRKLYDAALNRVIEDLNAEYNTILTKMSVLQMICNNPASVNLSQGGLAQVLAQNYSFTDKHSAKLEKLHDLLDEIDGKVVLFSAYNEYGAQMLAPYLVKWGHSYVLYGGDAKKKQAAQDKFKTDSRVKIFLSSDQGSDSINLQEATTVINYDLPWNYSTLEQRVNRINRITSDADHVFYHNLIVADTIEERKLKVLNRKKSYHKAVFDGDIGDQAEILATTSVQDLLYILGVKRP